MENRSDKTHSSPVSSDEIVYHIFEKLDPKSLLTAGLVSGEWNRLANDKFLWKELYLTYFQDYYATAKNDERDWKEKFYTRLNQYFKKYYSNDIALKDIFLSKSQIINAIFYKHSPILGSDSIKPLYLKLAVDVNNPTLCNHFYSVMINDIEMGLPIPKSKNEYTSQEYTLLMQWVFYTIYLNQPWQTIQSFLQNYNLSDDDILNENNQSYLENNSLLFNRSSIIHRSFPSLFLIAAYAGNMSVIAHYLEKDGKLLNIVDAKGLTIFHWALINNRFNVIQFLLAHAESTNTPIVDKRSQIFNMVVENNIFAELVGVSKNIDQSIEGNYITDLLANAAFYGHIEQVKLMCESHPDVKINMNNDKCNIVLHYLVKTQGYNILKYLLENGASVDAVIKNQNDPDFNKSLLLVATEVEKNDEKKAAIIQLLLEYGAELKSKEKIDLTKQSSKAKTWLEFGEYIKSLENPPKGWLSRPTRDEKKIKLAKKLQEIYIHKNPNILWRPKDHSKASQELLEWRNRIR